MTYRSVQPGLPDAQHERRFEPVADGFTYHLVVTYAARAGWPVGSTAPLSAAGSTAPFARP